MVEINPFSPGFCIKTNSSQGKVFINICHSPSIPPPADMTEDELLQILEEDQAAFRIPMSLGEAHAELDASQCRQRTQDPSPSSSLGSKGPGPRTVLQQGLEIWIPDLILLPVAYPWPSGPSVPFTQGSPGSAYPARLSLLPAPLQGGKAGQVPH